MAQLGIVDGWQKPPSAGHAEHINEFLTKDVKAYDWSEQFIGIPTAWQQTQGEGIRVFAADTGVDYNHPDLKDNVKGGFNLTHDPHDYEYMDRDGHGTHVCGIIAANGQISGVAPKCDLFMGKILGDDGSGQTSYIIDAVKYAMRLNVDILSMSLGTHTQPEDSVLQALQAASKAGTVIVVAAGNEGREIQGDSVSWPAKYVSQIPELIVVGAVDKNSGVPSWSSKGGEVTIVAPGVDIYSTYPKNRYQKMSGSSMATPFTSGTVALMLAKHRKDLSLNNGNLFPPEVKKLLQDTAKHANGVIGKNDQFGYGIIDIGAIQKASI
jgi:subtilisin